MTVTTQSGGTATYSAYLCAVGTNGFPLATQANLSRATSCVSLTKPTSGNKYTPPANTALASGRTYSIIAAKTGGVGRVIVNITWKDAEDATPAAGWSIGNSYDWWSSRGREWRTASATQHQTLGAITRALRIAVKGTTRSASTDATLSALALSEGTLSPTFSSAGTSYTASVGNAVSSITVTPTTNDAGATDFAGNSSAKPTVEYLDASDTALTDADTASTDSFEVDLSSGSNVITVKVTAADGTTVKTYTVTVMRAAAPTDAILSALSLSSGTLSPTFSSAHTSYTASVGYPVSRITVTPATGHASATVTYLDASDTALTDADTASTDSFEVDLSEGANVIKVKVTAAEGAALKTYTVTVTRAAASTDATLGALSLSPGTLNPAFASAGTSYTASVGYPVSRVTLSATASDAGATIAYLDGSDDALTDADTASTDSFEVDLSEGANVIKVQVTAENGTTVKTYTVTVTRAAASTDATLGALALSPGTLNPTFASADTSYTASVVYAVSRVTVSPTTNYSNAGIAYLDGSDDALTDADTASTDSFEVDLSEGANVIKVQVTAEDATTTETYTVTVTRAAPSTDATLSALSLSSGTLSPMFASAHTSYTASVVYAVSRVTVSPTTNYSNATIAYLDGSDDALTDADTASTGSFEVDLSEGANVIKVKVTAEDGATTETYTVTVTRAAPSTDATLGALALSPGTLNPTFSPADTSYTASVVYAVSRVTVATTTNYSNAGIAYLDGSDDALTDADTSSTGSFEVDLSEGANVIKVKVTAEDGATTETYTVTVTRAAPSTDATLSALALSRGTLSPMFASAHTSYTASVVYAVSRVTVAPTKNQATATIAYLDGSDDALTDADTSSTGSFEVDLSEGANVIKVQVTAEDATTTETYTVTVTRAAASTDATLSALALSRGTLSPVFASADTSYTASVVYVVTRVTVAPTKNQATATIAYLDGSDDALTDADTSSTGSFEVDLSEGANVIKVKVTAADATTTETYTVTVTRAAPSTDDDDFTATTATQGTVSVGGSATGEIEIRGDLDWFAVTLEAGQAYRIDLEGSRTNAGTLVDPYLRGVHDAAGTLIAGTTNDDGGTGGNSRLTFTAESSATYYVAAGAYEDLIGTYKLWLSVTEVVTDDFAATTATEGTVSVGGSATGEIEVKGDVDWFAVTLEAGKSYRIDLKGSPTGDGTLRDTYLYGVHDAAGTRLARTTNDGSGTGRNSQVRFTAGASATYYVAAGASEGFASSSDREGTYTLTVTELSDDFTATTATQGTVSAGGSATGEIELIGDVDWFAVTLETGQSYRIDLEGAFTSAGTVVDPYLRGVHDAAGTLIAGTTNNDGGTKRNSRLTFAAESSATYYVAAGAAPTQTGTYTLSVTAVTPPPSSIWTATLTVKALRSSRLGCDDFDRTRANWCKDTAVLTNKSVTYGADTYNMTRIRVTSGGRLELRFNTDISTEFRSDLVFKAGDSEFVLSGTSGSSTASWTNSGLSWSEDDEVSLAFVVKGAPTAADGEVTTAEDTAYTFAATDFVFVGADATDTLSSVKITALPTVGSLTLDDTAVDADDSITKADIDDSKLVFTPAANANGDGYTDFSFKLNDGTTESAAAYTMSIDVTAVNDVPAGVPTISGTATVGETLIASATEISDADGLTGATFAWQWVRIDGTDETDITGATSITYVVVTADLDDELKVEVSFTDDDDTDEGPLSSAATAAVGPKTQRQVTNTDATLSVLSLSPGTLNPTFSPAVTSYTASVGYPVSRITVAPTKNQASATIAYLDGSDGALTDADTSSTGSFEVDLSVGANVIKVQVTAGDDTTVKTYTVTVTRAAASTDATLSALSLSPGTLSPGFASAGTSYTASVGYPVSRVTLSATASDSGATIAYLDGSDDALTDADTASTDSFEVDLSEGANVIKVQVTAEDATTTETYTVTVTRAAPSTDATLSALSLSSGTLNPTFASADTSYTASVVYAVSRVTVSPTTNYSNATIAYLDGSDDALTDADTSSTDTFEVDLSEGANVIKVKVTAEDATTTETYTVTVTRAAPSTDAALSALSLSPGTLSPAFSSADTSYTASVGYAVSRVTVAPTKNQASATIAYLDGSDDALTDADTFSTGSFEVDLSVGANVIKVKVTAEDATTTETYTVTVTRAAPSTDDDDFTATTATQGTVSVGGSATGEIEIRGDLDWFAVTLEAGQAYRIDLEGSRTNAGTLVDPYLRGVHDAAGTLIAGTTNDDGGTGGNSRLTFTAESSATYYVAAGAYEDLIGTYKLWLSVTEVVTDDFAATTATEGTVSVGGSATGEIEIRGDVDWFAVTLEAGKSYRIDLKGSPTGDGTLRDTYLYGVHDAAGTRLARTTNDGSGTGRNSQVRFTAGASATYYVAAGASEGFASSSDREGTYTLTVTELSDDFTATTATQGTVSAGGSATGEIELIGDVDWFAVTLETGQSYRIDLEGAFTSAGTVVDPYLRGVHDAAGTLIAGTTNNDGGTKRNSRLTFAAESSATYYVAAGAAPTQTGTYTLSVTTVTPPPSSIWTATLTVQDLGSGNLGCDDFNRNQAKGCRQTAVLTNRSVTYGTNTYNMRRIRVTSLGTLELRFNTDISTEFHSDLVFKAGDSEFMLSDKSRGTDYWWTTSGLSWSEDDEVSLAFVVKGAPTAADGEVTTAEDTAYTFAATDFGFVGAGATDTLSSVKITALPTLGSLTLDDTAVDADDSITKADIDDSKLVFTPAANANGDGYTTFSFKLNDGTTESAAAYTMSIDVTAVNDVPAGVPTISGTAKVGETLIASATEISDADGLAGAVFTWQWVRIDGKDETDITGATSITYVVVTADLDDELKVEVSFTDDDDTDEGPFSSAATAAVAAKTQRQVTNTDATLSVLSLSPGTLSPGFSPAVTIYTASVVYAVTRVTVSPTKNQATATIAYLDGSDGALTDADTSTTGSFEVDLSVGANVIKVQVTAGNTTTVNTYTVTVTRADPSIDAALSALSLRRGTLSLGTLSPAFASADTIYTASVGTTVERITVSPTTNDANATVEFLAGSAGDQVLTDGDTSSADTFEVYLWEGNNLIKVKVTAEDGTATKTYSVTVIRASPVLTDRLVSNLGQIISPSNPRWGTPVTSKARALKFSTGSYPASLLSVEFSILSFTSTATPTVKLFTGTESSNGTLTLVDEVASLTGPASLTAYAWAKTYTFTAPANTEDLAVNTDYYILVEKSSGDGFQLWTQGTGGAVDSGSKAGWAILSNFWSRTAGSTGTLSRRSGVPVFRLRGSETYTAPGKPQGLTATPGNAEVTLTWTAPASDGGSAITHYQYRHATGSTVPTGTSWTNVADSSDPGDSTADETSVTVTSLTNEMPYAFEVRAVNTVGDGTKAGPATATPSAAADAALSALSLSPGTLSPEFSSSQTAYTASVDGAVSRVTVSATAADSDATIAYLDGSDNALTDADTSTDTFEVALSVGNNDIKVKVTAENGTTTRTYTVTVTRGPASTDATLSALAVSPGTLSPEFSSEVTSYTASVGYPVSRVTVSATAADSDATIAYLDESDTVLTDADTSSTDTFEVALSVGGNAIKVKVTAADSATMETYTVTVTRGPASSDATLSALAVSPGTLSPGFSPEVTSYTASVRNTVSRITVTPTTSHASAVVAYLDASDTALTDAETSSADTFEVDLSEGTTVIKVKVTAGDSVAMKTYTVVVTRAIDGDLRLVDGEVEYEGRLEMFHGDEWGTICDDYWTEEDAAVACRQLGHAGAERTFLRSAFGGAASGVPVWLDDVLCTRTEARLIDCPRAGNQAVGAHNCSRGHTEDAGVRCVEEPAPGTVDEDGFPVFRMPDGEEYERDASATVTPGTTTVRYTVRLSRAPANLPPLSRHVRMAVEVESPGRGATVEPATGYWAQPDLKPGGWTQAEEVAVTLPASLRAGAEVSILHTLGRNGDADNDFPGEFRVTLTVAAQALVGEEAPAITGAPALSEAGTDGVWAPGETAEVTLTFSEAVTVDTTGGTPSVGLSLGGTKARRATYRRGSGTTALVFGYTLTAADGSHSSLLVPIDGLALNGGAIRSQASGADAALGHLGTAKVSLPPQDEGDPFTARFEGLPERHDGAGAFSFELRFSEAPQDLSDSTVANGLLEVTGAAVTGARRLAAGSNLAWEVTVTPSQSGNIAIRLPARACTETHAVCAGGRALANAVSATVEGVPLTASFSGVPAEHDGATAFDIRFHLSEEPAGLNYRTVRDGLFDVTGGRIERASRLTPGKNNGWSLHIDPSGVGDVTVRVKATSACGSAPGVCTADGRKLAGGLQVVIAGPATLSVADTEVEEASGATLDFVVTLSKARFTATTVDYATSDDTATAGSDYTSTSDTLTFAPLETTKTVSVAVLDDAVDEGSETMTLTLSNPSGAKLADAEATGTITNTDPMPKAWAVRFGRTVGSQLVDALKQRLDGGGGSHVTVGGMNLAGGGCCSSLCSVGTSRYLTGLFRRRIAWDDGTIREGSGAGEVAFAKNRCC